MVAQEWILDIASTILLRNMSERSRLNNVTKNIPGISLAAVEAADAEQRWRDQNEHDLETLAQAWMLDAAVIKDVRDRSERARLFNKPKPKCLRDRAAIDSGASETMTNNLALVSNPVSTDILVRQVDGSCVPGQYLRGKLSAKSLGIALPRMDVIYNKNFATTLVSTPQLNRMGMEVILSPTFGSFMQPKGDVCPASQPHQIRSRLARDVADAGACNHTLSQPHDFIRMTVHSQGPSVKGEKAIPEKSPAERPGGGACLPPFPPPSEAPALSPPASDGSPAASPPAAHRPDQGQCVLCGPTALRTRPTTPTRTSEAGRRRDYRQLRSYKKAIPEKITC